MSSDTQTRNGFQWRRLIYTYIYIYGVPILFALFTSHTNIDGWALM